MTDEDVTRQSPSSEGASPAASAPAVDEETRAARVIFEPPRSLDRMCSRDCLVVVDTAEPRLRGARFALDDGPAWIGRGVSCHIVLAEDTVSRRHARMELRGARWWLVDDGSASGTYCDGVRIEGAVALSGGERIMIGSTLFKLLVGEEGAAESDPCPLCGRR